MQARCGNFIFVSLLIFFPCTGSYHTITCVRFGMDLCVSSLHTFPLTHLEHTQEGWGGGSWGGVPIVPLKPILEIAFITFSLSPLQPYLISRHLLCILPPLSLGSIFFSLPS